MKGFAVLIIWLLTAAQPASFSEGVFARARAGQGKSALIIHSASATEVGYRISVEASGEASFVDGRGEGKGSIPPDLAAAFFTDLDKGDISRLKVSRKCYKPVSIATTISIRYDGKESPDIDCAGDSQSKTLLRDVHKIAAALKVVNMQPGKGKELPPLQN